MDITKRVDLYLKAMDRARLMCTTKHGNLILYIGDSQSRYTRIEQLAWDKYMSIKS